LPIGVWLYNTHRVTLDNPCAKKASNEVVGDRKYIRPYNFFSIEVKLFLLRSYGWSGDVEAALKILKQHFQEKPVTQQFFIPFLKMCKHRHDLTQANIYFQAMLSRWPLQYFELSLWMIQAYGEFGSFNHILKLWDGLYQKSKERFNKKAYLIILQAISQTNQLTFDAQRLKLKISEAPNEMLPYLFAEIEQLKGANTEVLSNPKDELC